MSTVPYLAWRGEAVRHCLVRTALGLPAGLRPQRSGRGLHAGRRSGDLHLATPQTVTAAPGFNSAIFSVRGLTVRTAGDELHLTEGWFRRDQDDRARRNRRPGSSSPRLPGRVDEPHSIVLCNSAAPGPCTGPTTDVITDVAGQSTPNILEANVTGNIPLLQNFNEARDRSSDHDPDGTSVPGVVCPMTGRAGHLEAGDRAGAGQ